MNVPRSIPDLISNWEKLTHFAADVGCGYEAARKMRDRESIAPEHWQNVISASESKGIPGVTYEWLAKQRATSAPGTSEQAA
ncbi:MAG: hypothetical protein EOQ41_16040 [Mesorhizobium sp.]|uniref:hypothetical protein n=1 Tax=Mesorhizobium sp. TaxID=1871066 RepID=UPI000FE7C32B|nr:hypothetical protein [Mesorhizobium sp.]RWB29620.1 MAG: hypothetical protein EOQ41_16040 [Mesorhizobium sp.]